jgi:chromosomal replication initiation ATPase DnaA
MGQPKTWPDIYVPLGTVIDAVLDVFDLTRKELMSSPKRKTPTLARGAAIIIARHCSPSSWDEIGRALDMFSGSVRNCHKRSIELQKKDPRYAELIQRSLDVALRLMVERAGGRGPGIVKTRLTVVE